MTALSLILLTGCGGSDKLLKELDGYWLGSANVDVGTYDLSATFTYGEYLSGEVLVSEPQGSMAYAVRRAEQYGDLIQLELLEATESERALDLDGELDDAGAFIGQITMTFDCDPQICGYEGQYTLTKGLAPGGTGATTTDDTGTPTTPTGTPPDDTGTTPGDTSTAGGTGATPGGTAAAR